MSNVSQWQYAKAQFVSGKATYLECISFDCGHDRYQNHPSHSIEGDMRWCEGCASPQRVLVVSTEGDHWSDPADSDPLSQHLKKREEAAKRQRRAMKDPALARKLARGRLVSNVRCSRCKQSFTRTKRSRSEFCKLCRSARNREANRSRHHTSNEKPRSTSVSRQPAGHKSPHGSADGRSTFHSDLAGWLDTLSDASAAHPWWAKNKNCFDDLL